MACIRLDLSTRFIPTVEGGKVDEVLELFNGSIWTDGVQEMLEKDKAIVEGGLVGVRRTIISRDGPKELFPKMEAVLKV